MEVNLAISICLNNKEQNWNISKWKHAYIK